MKRFGTSIWNLNHASRTGANNLDIMKNGREWYGTVIKHGLMDKTITVRVDYKFYVQKYKAFCQKWSKFLVHDEENFAISGDKVIIRGCKKLSARKNYYLLRVVKAFPRNDYYVKEKTEKEKQLDLEYQKTYQEFYDSMIKKATIRNKKEEQSFKAKLKAKAMSKVIMNLRKMEKDQKLKQERLDRNKIDSSKLPENKEQQETLEYLKV